MYLEQLEYILEVAKTGSIINASKNLHVSPSGISQSISQLEDEFGVKIFSRARGQSAVPTDEGELIIKQAIQIIMNVQRLQEMVGSFSSLNKGSMKVAAITGVMPFLLKAKTSIKADYPQIDFQIIESNTEEIINDVKQHKIDIGFIAVGELIIDSDLSSEVLLESEIKVYVNKNSLLACNKRVKPQELLNFPFIIYKDEYYNWLTQELFRDLGKIDIVFSSSNVDVLKSAVAEDIGISLAPDYYMKNDPYVLNGIVIPLEIEVNEKITNLSIHMVWSKDKHSSNLIHKFVKYVKACLQ
ncbi:LysR family transcriptional regulator [Gottfriedia acidiceleris]|uniref:LysR family transcriptional regulator n=1 Tax=Gottfriedia acidiceleris TaxID=371036 RepID=UPI003D1D6728